MTANIDRVCAAHRDVYNAERNLIPPDPFTRLPVLRQTEFRACQACDGAGVLYPGVDCDNCDGLGFYLPPNVGEAASPTKGTEA